MAENASTSDKLITRDWLAIERTHLANERTLLAYLRTFIVFLGSGLGILKVDLFSDLIWLGVLFTISSFIILVIGIIRFFQVKQGIKRYYIV